MRQKPQDNLSDPLTSRSCKNQMYLCSACTCLSGKVLWNAATERPCFILAKQHHVSLVWHALNMLKHFFNEKCSGPNVCPIILWATKKTKSLRQNRVNKSVHVEISSYQYSDECVWLPLDWKCSVPTFPCALLHILLPKGLCWFCYCCLEIKLAWDQLLIFWLMVILRIHVGKKECCEPRTCVCSKPPLTLPSPLCPL